MVNLQKIEIDFLEDHSDTMFVPNSLKECFMFFFLFLVTAAVGHLGLPSCINTCMKGLQILQIILTEFN